ncbi:hypothetical protein PIB30_054287 [Stylosanthes scabra]|uniref:Putative plant transposon protein domain-containing protein n=1 Tax=Stylosanthes scabra TaxID=79078 RepID=A0ABU6WJ87_9FABA|nr:hypothetical protein [Stylosanthes scabra]
MRGWRRLSKPRSKISKVLIQEFYANAIRTEAEIANGENYPYMSYVRGVLVDFSAAKLREVLKIRFLTPGAEIDFKTRQMEDQRLDEVIRDICMPGARWKMSTSQTDQPIQLKRQDLTPLARGWAEFIIHSIIPTGNKSDITVARAVLIHSIIKGHDVRVEELIADNIAIIAEAAQGRSKLSFPSTIFRLCKEAGVSMAEFRGTEFIPVAKPIIAKKTQAQYLEELKALKTKQNEMHTQQNNFYRQIRKEQGDLTKKIEEIKKFQVNQTLMGFRSGPLEKMEEMIHETRNEIIEMRGQIKEWTKNASAR